jgi:hypothetical protein
LTGSAALRHHARERNKCKSEDRGA